MVQKNSDFLHSPKFLLDFFLASQIISWGPPSTYLPDL